MFVGDVRMELNNKAIEATDEWSGFAEGVEDESIKEINYLISNYITRKEIIIRVFIYIFFFISLILGCVGVFLNESISLFIAVIFGAVSTFMALIEWI